MQGPSYGVLAEISLSSIAAAGVMAVAASIPGIVFVIHRNWKP